MTEIFTAVLNMSITASYIAGAVITARIFMRRIPRIFSYILWLPVFVRLICPYSFNSALSLLNMLEGGAAGNRSMEYIPHNIGMMQKPEIHTGIGIINSGVNSSLPQADPYGSVNTMQIVMAAANGIWIIGMTVLCIYCVTSWIKVYIQLRTAALIRENIYETDRIQTPFVFGIFKPSIYVPSGLSEQELLHITLHERVHIKRYDYIIKPAAFLVLIVHWFNPLMWISFRLMSEDMELSCDERVIKDIGEEKKIEYSKSLLSLSVKRSGIVSKIAFGENSVKARIKNILRFKKPALWMIIAAAAVVSVCIFAFITNPKVQAAKAVRINHTTKTLVQNDDLSKKIEKNITIITSSPATSSNPHDYINTHRREYENILKMGEPALAYILSEFKKGSTDGLRGHILMYLCKDMLGGRNNVKDTTLSPEEWYAKLSLSNEVKLPDFKSNSKDEVEKLIYDTVIKRYSMPGEGFTIVAPTIFGNVSEGNRMRVFVTVFSCRYRLYGRKLIEEGGSVIPAAITFMKGDSGKYSLVDYREAMDGSYFSKSIKDFCVMPLSGKKVEGMYKKIIDDYGNNKDRYRLMQKNLREHLMVNKHKGVDIYGRSL